MSFYAAANGVRVTACALTLPYYGAPVAEVTLADASTLVAPVALAIGNLVLTMGIVRQKPFAGITSALLMGGAARWGGEVTLPPYNRPAGVLLSTVLGDLAMATRSDPANASTGERVSLATDRSLGVFYVPETAPASRLLRELAGSLWWIDTAGTTQIAPRPSKAITSAANVTDLEGAPGWLRVATEDPASWQPGNTFRGPTVPASVTVGASRIVIADNALRVEVLTADALTSADPGAPTPQDRTMAALRALIRGEDPGRTYLGRYRYAVHEADATSFSGVPVDAAVAPALPVRVPYSPALAGSSCVPTPGTVAHVVFADGSPSYPILVGFDQTVPSAATVDCTGTLAVGPSASSVVTGSPTTPERYVREGDTYTATGAVPGAVVLTFLSTTQPSGPTKGRG